MVGHGRRPGREFNGDLPEQYGTEAVGTDTVRSGSY